jgi:hypothetical protein
LRFDVAERLQFVISLLHRERRNHDLFAQLAVRRQLLARLQSPGGNSLHDLPHDLAVNREFARRVDRNVHLL